MKRRYKHGELKNIEFSLYKGDEEIAFGTIKEIADKLGVSDRTILFYTTPTYEKRVKKGKNRRVLIKVGD